MAALSAIAALRDLYNSISATTFGGTTRPPIYMGEAPATNTGGTQQRPPYCVLRDSGFAPEFQSNTSGIEKAGIDLEIYADKLDGADEVTVDSIARAVKWGDSGIPEDKQGFDWGELTFDVAGNYYSISIRRTRERREYVALGVSGQRVHKCTLSYEVTIGLKPS